MSSIARPPQGASGKWIVILMIPIILLSFAWLAYNRINFVHPTATVVIK